MSNISLVIYRMEMYVYIYLRMMSITSITLASYTGSWIRVCVVGTYLSPNVPCQDARHHTTTESMG